MENLTFKPLPGTTPTLIYDAYGASVLVYFPKGDTEGPRNLEVGIRSAQLGISVEQYKKQSRR